ncbi:MAG: MarR family transcriptional regulator [Alphaproteobacteria bacterium]|jgi:DNA-binding MarR family transcriptional regulator|nr:MarR family transcriptional regulator [Alphaproteobacteria bacterium]MDP6515926.1 MarR family transcriptional regulator [Alphaproteobacteria bacterium]
MGLILTTEQALKLWHSVFAQCVSGEWADLTMRQMALLLTVYMTPPEHTVRGLAKGLNISKPAVTRGLDRLAKLGLIRRKRDDGDKRNVLVQRTVKGSVYLSELADLIGDASAVALADSRDAA